MIVRNLSLQDFKGHGDIPRRLKLFGYQAEGTIAGIMYFDEGWLHLPTWCPVTGDGVTCAQIYHYLGRAEKYREIYAPMERIREMASGTPLSGVYALGGDRNHWHFMMDFLPRLIFLIEIPELAERPIGHSFTVSQLDFLRLLLRNLGLGDRSLVEIPMDRTFVPLEDVVVPTRISRRLAVMIWENYLWPKTLRPPSEGRRIFILRDGGARRRLLNQDELASRLQAEGFESVNPGAMSIQLQIQLFAESEFVVGVSGAAMTGLLFVPKTCRVVELSNQVVQHYYLHICSHRGIKHTVITGQSDVEPSHHTDFTVDIDKILSAVKSM